MAGEGGWSITNQHALVVHHSLFPNWHHGQCDLSVPVLICLFTNIHPKRDSVSAAIEVIQRKGPVLACRGLIINPFSNVLAKERFSQYSIGYYFVYATHMVEKAGDSNEIAFREHLSSNVIYVEGGRRCIPIFKLLPFNPAHLIC